MKILCILYIPGNEEKGDFVHCFSGKTSCFVFVFVFGFVLVLKPVFCSLLEMVAALPISAARVAKQAVFGRIRRCLLGAMVLDSVKYKYK